MTIIFLIIGVFFLVGNLKVLSKYEKMDKSDLADTRFSSFGKILEMSQSSIDAFLKGLNTCKEYLVVFWLDHGKFHFKNLTQKLIFSF